VAYTPTDSPEGSTGAGAESDIYQCAVILVSVAVGGGGGGGIFSCFITPFRLFLNFILLLFCKVIRVNNDRSAIKQGGAAFFAERQTAAGQHEITLKIRDRISRYSADYRIIDTIIPRAVLL